MFKAGTVIERDPDHYPNRIEILFVLNEEWALVRTVVNKQEYLHAGHACVGLESFYKGICVSAVSNALCNHCQTYIPDDLRKVRSLFVW